MQLSVNQNKMIDLRDKTDCPSFANFKNKDIGQLARLLVKALEGQIQALSEVKDYEISLMNNLKNFLVKVQRAYVKILDGNTSYTEHGSGSKAGTGSGSKYVAV